MFTMSDAEPSVLTHLSRPQFGLGTVLGMFFALGLYLAYLRQYEAEAVIYGCLAVLMGLAVGGASGFAAGHLADAAYWASLCAALGYVATVGEPNLGVEFRLAWSAVGAVAGAGTNLVPRKRPWLPHVRRGTGGNTRHGSLRPGFPRSALADPFDLMCAPIVGVLIAVLIEILQYVEADRRLPRYTIATWLLCAVLAAIWPSPCSCTRTLREGTA